VSREQVIVAAIAAIRDGRYETMTIRSLASELGVAPMTLYRHIRNRDDLLDEVADRLLAKSWRPRKAVSPWQDWTIDAAMRFRKLLVDQPAVLHVYLGHPVASPAAIERMQTMLGVFRDAGLNEFVAERTYATLHTYTLGFAALESSRFKWQATNRDRDATMRKLATFTTTTQFVAGLEILLRGVTRPS
jgi:AcrR family transcriptional regulator